MALPWYELTALTGHKEFVVTAIKMKETGIAVQGEFELAAPCQTFGRRT